MPPLTKNPSPILETFPLSSQWPTQDPFLFCAHHIDRYPAGTPGLGPADPTTGRNSSNDFSGRDGWSMYHGNRVPGFPRHPHRGFETISVVRRGLIDHADSVGASARYGPGDVQWVTTGSGIEHSEMFPLVVPDGDNPLEMLQIWLNLPAADKMVDPYFTMLWAEAIPTLDHVDAAGRPTTVRVIAGRLGGLDPLPPPENSWAAREESDLAVWEVSLTAGARWTMPPAGDGTSRAVYVFEGDSVALDGHRIGAAAGAFVLADSPVELAAGPGGASLIVLQGRPIGEPVAAYGPFVMNSQDEIRLAFADYRAGGFGRWSHNSPDPTHGPNQTRFAVHPDGRAESPPSPG